MVFNSIFFIFCFLPVFMLIYYLVPGKLRNLILFLGSLVFYAWGEPVYVILMLFSSIFNYYMGAELERLYYDEKRQKLNLVFAVIVNLGILVFFKYYGFLLNTIAGSQDSTYPIRSCRCLSDFPFTLSGICLTSLMYI